MHARRLSRTALSSTLAAFALAASAGSAYAQCSTQTILPQGRAIGDTAGASVAFHDGYLLIGAPLDDNNKGSNAGGVWVLMRNENGTHTHSTILTNQETGAANAQFGAAVAFGDRFAAIGSPGHNKAHLYYRVNALGDWLKVTDITAPGLQPTDGLGASVAVNTAGTIAAFGIPLADQSVNMQNTGAVIVYVRDGWNWVYNATLTDSASFFYSNDDLGRSVAAVDDIVFAGVPLGDAPQTLDCGRVNVYRRDGATWARTRIFSPEQTAGDRFGTAIAADGDLLVVGAPGRDHFFTSNTGSVYIFRRQGATSNYTHEATILSPDLADDGQFGASVSVTKTAYDELVTVGMPGAKRAYAFMRAPNGQWVQYGRYEDPTPQANSDFGRAVAASAFGNYVGDPSDNTGNLSVAGAAYAFGRPLNHGDHPAAAVPVFVGGSFFSCTEHFTRDSATTCGNQQPQGPDVWFRFTPEMSGTVTMTTVGSGFDTILSVHSATPGTAANTLACNDDIGGGVTASRVQMMVVSGQAYFVRVAGYNGAKGTVKLNVGPMQAACGADFNLDGSVNTADITAFLSAWFEARASGVNGRADFDASGGVNTADITAFLGAWFADRASGCGM